MVFRPIFDDIFDFDLGRAGGVCLMSCSSFLSSAIAHFLVLVDFFDGIADGQASFGL